MKKVIWIVSQESSTPSTGYGGRSYYIAKELVQMGHDVKLIMSASSHMHRVKPNVHTYDWEIEKHDGIDIVWCKTTRYQKAHEKGRVIGWFGFGLKLLRLKKKLNITPDTIVYSSPPLIPVFGVILLKFFIKSKLVIEVRDIWPLTLTEVGGISKYHPFIVFSALMERLSYMIADTLVSNLQFAIEHMKLKGAKANKFHWIPNGVCEVELDAKDKSHIIDKIPKEKFIVGYAGGIGVANYLDVLIQAAQILKNDCSIHIAVVGDGGEKQFLINKAAELNLDNISFYDAVKKSQVQSVLSVFDICYLGCENIDLYKYGISPNKLSEYMYAKKPVLLSFFLIQYNGQNF